MKKIVHNEGKHEGKKNAFASLNTVLPFEVAMSVAGVASLVSSVIYIVIKSHESRADLLILYVSLAAFAILLGIWIFVMVLGIRRNKELAKEKIEEDKEKLFNQLKKCESCSKAKITNGLEYNGIFDEEDVLEKERRFKDDNNANDCEVYIYVSDLSCLDNALDIIKENVEAGILYKIFYYRNDLFYKELDDIITPSNLICLKGKEDEEQCFDELASECMVNFKFILFKRHPNSVFGYASFDNLSQLEKNNPNSMHEKSHDIKCNECCSFDKERCGIVSRPFFYRLTYRKTNYILAKLDEYFEAHKNEE